MQRLEDYIYPRTTTEVVKSTKCLDWMNLPPPTTLSLSMWSPEKPPRTGDIYWGLDILYHHHQEQLDSRRNGLWFPNGMSLLWMNDTVHYVGYPIRIKDSMFIANQFQIGSSTTTCFLILCPTNMSPPDEIVHELDTHTNVIFVGPTTSLVVRLVLN